MDVTVDLCRPLKYIQNEMILGSIFTALLKKKEEEKSQVYYPWSCNA